MKIAPYLVAGAALIAISLVNADDKAGWTDLFDGKTLNGWKHSTLGTAKYSVVDGTIKGETVEGSPNSFLLSAEQYGDFELEFEVKVHDSLNSGVQIRSREKSEADVASTDEKKRNNNLGRFFGPQVEIEASPGQAGYVYGEATGRGWISKEPGEGAAHKHMKNGEWNKFRIVAKGNNIQTWINGNQVANLTDEEIFKTHPKGHIGLQVHGIKKGTGPYDVYWKNIRLKTL
ncbi:MAG: DUF1080 domain-containing protein [Verrucomicrobiales bacterium]|nr:DUF1080 domain-containing protein [Verrucomicrobiales bacterium]